MSTEDARHKRLANWLATQRQSKEKGKLSPERENLLDVIGVSWAPTTEAWQRMLSELKDYRDLHGDCDVPQSWAENLQLGRWVSKQRQRYKKGRLAQKQVEELKKLDFKLVSPRARGRVEAES